MADEVQFAPAIAKRTLEPAEHASALPVFGSDYKASGTIDDGCARLVLVMGKEGFEPGGRAYIALQYVHLGTGYFGFTETGQVFHFLYSDFQPKLLTVEGRNLLRIFDNVTLRRMPWIRVKDRDFRAVDDPSNEPVITAIRLEDWNPAHALGG